MSYVGICSRAEARVIADSYNERRLVRLARSVEEK